jgi:predicted Zn-dependent peptidase
VYTANNFVISAVGNLEHARVRELVERVFAGIRKTGDVAVDIMPVAGPAFEIRNKDLEQSHICLGAASYSQCHGDRYVSYVLNTLLGGSMSSRLFQNVREKRGLAYSVFSGLSAYRDTGVLTIYAGCANEAVGEVIDLTVEELRGVKGAPAPDAELRRAKDHLKGSLMLSLENTASRMSHLARQEIYYDRHFGLDETLTGVEKVSALDVQRVANELFADGALAGTVLGPLDGREYSAERLKLG